MDTGLIFISMLDTSNITQFTLINELLSIQSRLVANSQIDDQDLSIEVYTSNREEIEASSIMLICNTGSLSVDHSRVSEIFNSLLENNESFIKEISPREYICGVNIGATISTKELQNIKGIIVQSSKSPVVTSMVDIAISGVVISESSEATTMNLKTPDITQPYNFTPSPEGTSSGELKETDVVALATKVAEIIMSGESEVRGILEVLNADKQKIVSNMVDSAKLKINEYLETKMKDFVVVSPDAETISHKGNPNDMFPGITDNILPADVKAKIDTGEIGTESVNLDPTYIKDTKRTIPIYNDLVTIENLMEGCENDNQLFNKVMENKGRMTMDALENVSTFDMFEKMTSGSNETLGRREQRYRKQKLGL